MLTVFRKKWYKSLPSVLLKRPACALSAICDDKGKYRLSIPWAIWSLSTFFTFTSLLRYTSKMQVIWFHFLCLCSREQLINIIDTGEVELYKQEKIVLFFYHLSAILLVGYVLYIAYTHCLARKWDFISCLSLNEIVMFNIILNIIEWGLYLWWRCCSSPHSYSI